MCRSLKRGRSSEQLNVGLCDGIFGCDNRLGIIITRMKSRHECMIYGGSPDRHLPAIAAMMRQMLKHNHRCMYFNDPNMVANLRLQLDALCVNVQAELESGRLVLTSERPHLRDGVFDMDIMLRLLEEAFAGAMKDGYAGLWTSGDMTWEFGERQDFSKLREYESKLDEFFTAHPEYGGVCQYHGPSLPSQALDDAFHTHPLLFVTEAMSIPNPSYRDSEFTHA
jgi:hypothetical protein